LSSDPDFEPKNHVISQVLGRSSSVLLIVAFLEMGWIMGDGFELTEGDFARIGPRISKRSGEGQKGVPETPFYTTSCYWFLILDASRLISTF
jgi:hypothetical protein